MSKEYPCVEFEMELGVSAQLRVGRLMFWTSEGNGVSIPASAGLPGWQEAGHWMLKGKGPIPPSCVLGAGRPYLLSLVAEQRPNDKGIEGPFYRISPNSVRVSKEVERNGFGFHMDRNVIGSSGCIVPVEQVRGRDIYWSEAVLTLGEWRQRTGQQVVPLWVRYWGDGEVAHVGMV